MKDDGLGMNTPFGQLTTVFLMKAVKEGSSHSYTSTTRKSSLYHVTTYTTTVLFDMVHFSEHEEHSGTEYCEGCFCCNRYGRFSE